MLLDITKENLIDMIKGVQPNYKAMDNPVIKTCGSYSDNRGWNWNQRELNTYNETLLYYIYIVCKDSWK